MNIVFFGTPEFAVPALKAAAAAGHKILFAVSQPDRPAGRKQEILPTPVKKAAIELSIPVLQPEKVKSPGFMEQYLKSKPDLNLIAAFGQILPDEIIYHPKFHSINIHASLLPRWRGAAPINAAIMAGDKETGVSYQFIDKRLDCGDIMHMDKYEIQDNDDSITLYSKLSALAGTSVPRVLDMLESGKYERVKQDESLATLVKALKKEDGKIDFNKSNRDIFNMVRGLLPWPVSYCSFDDKILKIFKSEYIDEVTDSAPGTIHKIIKGAGFLTAAGKGSLLIKEVQLEGKKRMSASDFIAGHHDIIGKVLK
ncbi:MAG: methionyl-tRNA formyltransferase [Candidatus Goldbacteria bacterium]|nr:methionyl-tRNA formyltransferase [Candidatus Goldiibacteriota bacterium]